MHGAMGRVVRAQGGGAVPSGMGDGARIRRLGLRTAAPMDAMAAFYGDTMGLRVERLRENALLVHAGLTEITFISALPEDGEPYYHFAFNIPENKITAAHDWQAERTALVPTPEHMLDPEYPAGVRHFRNWNAHSVFFRDPAGNILEHIARHTLDNAQSGSFTPKDILYASEIAFTSRDVPATAKVLKERLFLPTYKTGSEQFHAVGDEHGLLLVFALDRIMIGDVPSRFYPTFASVKAGKDDLFMLPGAEHEIQARA